MATWSTPVTFWDSNTDQLFKALKPNEHLPELLMLKNQTLMLNYFVESQWCFI